MGELFSDIERRYEGLPDHSEPGYLYLDRSARVEAARVREVLEEWFSHYPEGHRGEFLGRFQSPDDQHHLSAFLELYLHELCRRLGCELTVHPIIPGTERSPDFLVMGVGGSSYLEATLATESSADELAAQARLDTVRDTLERITSQNFWLDFRCLGRPTKPLPGRRMRDAIEPWLARLDPDELLQRYNQAGYGSIPAMEFEHEGCRITIRAFPKGPRVRGRPGVRPLGIVWLGTAGGGFARLEAPSAIRTAVGRKATWYGDLDLPYIVGVNVAALVVDRDAFADALFGTLGPSAAPGEEARETRDRNGVWIGPEGPRNRRLSAALGTGNLTPWSIAQRDLCLYQNPWAYRPYVGELDRLTLAVVEGNLLRDRPGVHPRVIFELDERWPEHV